MMVIQGKYMNERIWKCNIRSSIWHTGTTNTSLLFKYQGIGTRSQFYQVAADLSYKTVWSADIKVPAKILDGFNKKSPVDTPFVKPDHSFTGEDVDKIRFQDVN